jgi:hypothetical protein
VEGFVVAGMAMLIALLPLGLAMVHGSAMDAVVAYEGATSVVVMVLVCLPEGFSRSGLFEFPVLLAVIMLGAGLVFLHALERWL